MLCIIVPVWSTVNTRSVSDDKLLLIRQNLYVAGQSGKQHSKLITAKGKVWFVYEQLNYKYC